MGRPYSRHLGAANVLATLALVFALTGTSYAAIQITGANVKNSTLTSKDVKAGSLVAADLSASARVGLTGPIGDAGFAGTKGVKGAIGAKGATGPVGAPANTRASWASWDAGYIDTTNPGLNSGLADWHAWEFDTACATPDCHLKAAQAGNAISLDGAAGGTTVIDLTTAAPAGGGGSSAGQVTTPWQSSTMLAWANVTLMYRTESDSPVVHTRAECWMTIDGAKAGPSVFVSSAVQRELTTVFLVGNVIHAPGTYDAAAVCRDADATAGITRWQAVRANLSMMANEKV